MYKNYKIIFLALVLAQGLHSIEEYHGELWNVFPPATALCSLISDDLRTGFLIINIGLFIVGLIVWFLPVRLGYTSAKYFIWFWICLEISNGIVHTMWSIYQKSYTPGLLTAPLLFFIALYLARLSRAIDK